MAPSLTRIEESQAVMSNNNSNNRDEVPPEAASVREQQVNPSTNNGPNQHVNDDAQHNTSPGPSDVQGETQVPTAGRRSNTPGTNQPPVAAGATATAASQSGQEGHPQPLLKLIYERWEADDAQSARRQEETRAELDAQRRATLADFEAQRREARAENDALRQDNEIKFKRQVQAIQTLAHGHKVLQEELEEVKEKVNEQEKFKTALEEELIRLNKENESTKAKVKRVKREQVKKEREEGKPKRPLTKPNCYTQDIGRKWREMSEEERESLYGAKVRQAKVRYDQDMKDYNERKKSKPGFVKPERKPKPPSMFLIHSKTEWQKWKEMSEEEKMRYDDLVKQDKERFLEESKQWEESKLSLDERKPAAEPSPQESDHEEPAATTKADDPEDPTTATGSPQEVDPDNYQPSEYELEREANIARNNERLIRLGLAQGGIAATATEPAQAAGLPRESSSTGAHEGAAANLTRNDTSAVINDRSVGAEINQEVSGAGSARAAEPPRESNQEVTTSVAAAAAAVNPDEDGNDQLSSPSETNKEGGKRKRDHESGARWWYCPLRLYVNKLKGYFDPDGEDLKADNVWVEFERGEIRQVKRNDLAIKSEDRLRPRPRHNLLSGGSERSDQGPIYTEYPVGAKFCCIVPSSSYHPSYICTAEVIEVIADGKFGVLFSLPYFGAIRSNTS